MSITPLLFVPGFLLCVDEIQRKLFNTTLHHDGNGGFVQFERLLGYDRYRKIGSLHVRCLLLFKGGQPLTRQSVQVAAQRSSALQTLK
jgi:hypothetical protein